MNRLMQEYEREKLAASQLTPQLDTMGLAGEYRRPSLREEAEKRVGHHRSEADKADRAVAFFRDHPEFDEFINLIRQGVIQI